MLEIYQNRKTYFCNIIIMYSQVRSNSHMSQDRVKFAHPVFFIYGGVMLNKLWLGKVCS